jgi:hypothetical protein
VVSIHAVSVVLAVVAPAVVLDIAFVILAAVPADARAMLTGDGLYDALDVVTVTGC